MSTNEGTQGPGSWRGHVPHRMGSAQGSKAGSCLRLQLGRAFSILEAFSRPQHGNCDCFKGSVTWEKEQRTWDKLPNKKNLPLPRGRVNPRGEARGKETSSGTDTPHTHSHPPSTPQM